MKRSLSFLTALASIGTIVPLAFADSSVVFHPDGTATYSYNWQAATQLNGSLFYFVGPVPNGADPTGNPAGGTGTGPGFNWANTVTIAPPAGWQPGQGTVVVPPRTAPPASGSVSLCYWNAVWMGMKCAIMPY